MRAFVERLVRHPVLGPMVVHHRRTSGRGPDHGSPSRPLPLCLAEALRHVGVDRLYSHQARALDLVRESRHVLTVTPTASGKTLTFAVPVLESLVTDPGSRALFVYPTKALARDQLDSLNRLAHAVRPLGPPRFEVYDGDVRAHLRRRLRQDPPEVVVTNPDMLHRGILSHHAEWEPFLRRLDYVVLDELHVYRGIFGAHVHHVLRRLRRVCDGLGRHPRFLAASATVGNPGEFARLLVGEPFEVVQHSGAPAAARTVLFLNPVGVSPYTVALRVVAEAAAAGLKTIAFTKARRIAELLYAWLVRQEPGLAGRIAPYRAGYLPAQRRAIESRLFRGELTAVLSTSALELGIDVGDLDACVLVGYPGSLISTWQRIGRVGRAREALVVLIAMPDALDQYVVHHPELLFGEGFERAVLDPWNPFVASHHLVCAAAERPLGEDELGQWGPRARVLVESLAGRGRLAQSAEGTRWFSLRRRPHRDVGLRSAGDPYTIVDTKDGVPLGSVDGIRVLHECHPGAIYLHGGRSYRIVELDQSRRRVSAQPVRVGYYTVVMGEKETRILERMDRRDLVASRPIGVGLGRLEVTLRIHAYQKRALFGGDPISTHPLDLPPLTFETVGLWIELPRGLAAALPARGLHFMGGLHATEHAMIGLFPLLAIADRGDVGGISYTGHPQTGGPAIFLYDGVPGGAGLAEQGYRDLVPLIERTDEAVAGCACEAGCPACIQSPQCGNGNKPLDKQAALLVLRFLLGREQPPLELPAEAPEDSAAAQLPGPPARARHRHGIVRDGNLEPTAHARLDPARTSRDGRVMVLDLETRRSAREVGGWGRVSRMGLALAVVYDLARGTYRSYREADVHRLLLDLVMADLVVGFNIDRFDLGVLSGYTDWDLGRIRTCDLLREIHGRLGFRISLGHLAEVNLGQAKPEDGEQSLRWWKEGRVDLIERYCRRDVDITRRLFELGRQQGYLLYRDREDRALRVPVRW